MNALFLALTIFVSAPSDSVKARVPNQDTAALSAAVDSQGQAKLEAVQRAWDGDSSSPTNAPAGRSTGSAVAQIISSLAVLLGLGGIGFMLLRWVRRKGDGRTAKSGSLLDVLETKPLGQGNHVTLVRVHDRVVALGHGVGGVSAIAEFHGADAARILAELGDGAVSVRDFTATLDTFLERFRAPTPTRARGPEE